jgi:hypothetical protein
MKLRSHAKLQSILDYVPYVPEGRGVTAALDTLCAYMSRHDLCESPRNAIAQAAVEGIGASGDVTVHYSPGSRDRRSYYRSEIITGRPELDHALACQPDGLRVENGLVVTCVGRGTRHEWRYSAAARRWVVQRKWCVVGKNRWITGRRRRLGRYQFARTQVWSQGGWECRYYADRLTRSEYIDGWIADRSGPDDWECRSIVDAFRRFIRANVHVCSRIYQTWLPTSDLASVSTLLRCCPAGWSVVRTPVSEGGPTMVAIREESSGEEYHFDPSCGSVWSGRQKRCIQRGLRSAWVAKAAAAFARRRELREERALLATIDRGEAAGVYVRFSDSLDAGNCRAGTSAFVSSHGLDATRHYCAGELIGVANGDRHAVRAAVLSAIRRHHREMTQGYCSIN